MNNREYMFYSLLYIHENNTTNVNLKKTDISAIDTYINCGRLLAASCKKFGINYAIITNEPEMLQNRVDVLGGGVTVINGSFFRDVPSDIKFYSAHFKLDVITAFGEGMYGDYIGLIDLDMVFLKKIDFDKYFSNLDSLYIYDITNQVLPSVGREGLLNTIQQLGAPVSQEPHWYGGEFIFGSKEVFRKLGVKIDHYWNRYILCYQNLHHIGDEAIVTAALLDIKKSGVQLIDIGGAIDNSSSPILTRWWSSRTLGKQVAFNEASQASLLHLPSDKDFLSKESLVKFNERNFIKRYKKHLLSKILPRYAMNIINKIQKKRKMYVPRIF